MPFFRVEYYSDLTQQWKVIVGPESDTTFETNTGSDANGLAAVQENLQGKFAAFPIAGASPASLRTLTNVANADLVFTHKQLGTIGNGVRIAFVVAGNNTALSVSVSGNDITINVATNGSGVATSTASQVMAAVNASTPASALVTASLAPGNDGTGVVVAQPLTNLAGGDTGAVTVDIVTFVQNVNTVLSTL